MADTSGSFADSTQMDQIMMPEPMQLTRRDRETKEGAMETEEEALAEAMDKEETLEEAKDTTISKLTRQRTIIINNLLLQRTHNQECILHQKTIYNAQVHCQHLLQETSTGPQGINDYQKDLCHWQLPQEHLSSIV